MKLLGFEFRRVEQRASAENPLVPVSASNFLQLFGINAVNLPHISTDTALAVPAVNAAVNFLSRTMAALPKHAYKKTGDGPKRVDGKLENIVHENPNPTMGAFKFWHYFWTQVFTGGRGLAWIERLNGQVSALWPLDPTKTTIKRDGFTLIYEYDKKQYRGEDVIDIPYMLQPDQTKHWGPINLAAKAIQLALAMNDFGSTFFAGGGVPPLAMVGPLPAGPEAMQRAMNDMNRVIGEARKAGKSVFPMPPGYELKQVGIDPDKGQMTEARRFQIEEIARAFQLPPVFLQDLSRATFSNAEQQDLHLVKWLLSQWALALESEMNLKIFGSVRNSRYVEHNLDGVLRGDFKTRMDGYASAIQHGVLMPNEARALENREDVDGGDKLYMQGAMLPIDKVGEDKPAPAPAPTPDAQGNRDLKDMIDSAVRQGLADMKPQTTNINIPEIRVPDVVARVEMPKLDPVEPPVVHVAAPVVNIEAPKAEKPKRKKTRTKVLKHDERGRIKEYEQEEID